MENSGSIPQRASQHMRILSQSPQWDGGHPQWNLTFYLSPAWPMRLRAPPSPGVRIHLLHQPPAPAPAPAPLTRIPYSHSLGLSLGRSLSPPVPPHWRFSRLACMGVIVARPARDLDFVKKLSKKIPSKINLFLSGIMIAEGLLVSCSNKTLACPLTYKTNHH